MPTSFAFAKHPRVLVLLATLLVLTLVSCLSLLAQGPKKMPPLPNSLVPLAPSECDGVAGNLVINCGFESGAFAPGWTLSGVDPQYNAVSSLATHTGSFGAVMGSAGGLGCITQTVPTIAGLSYTLSFWVANPYLGATPNNFQVWFGPLGEESQVAGDMGNMPTFGYTKMTIAGLTGSEPDNVIFCANNVPALIFLDDVVLVH